MVGAGRFERPTPCAQGSFWPSSKMPYSQLLTFQADGANLLQLVEPCGTRRLSPATFLSTAELLARGQRARTTGIIIDMGMVRISEAELTRDLHAVLAKVEQGIQAHRQPWHPPSWD